MATRSLDSFVELLLQLQPRGALWDWLSQQSPDALRYQRYLAYAEEFRRVDCRREDLLVEALPSTTQEKLEDWEQFLALPGTGTVAERQQAIVAKLFSAGNQSATFYAELGQLLGHNITVIKFRPRLHGDLHGEHYRSIEWRWAWVVTTDQSGVDLEFEQLIRDLAPAHVVLAFDYN